MLKRQKFPFSVFILILLLSTSFFILPSIGSSIFLSPDETAVAVAGRALSENGTFRVSSDLLQEYPWAHPRSWVTQNSYIVPVGFLGMPLIASGLWNLAREYGLALFTPLLVLSVLLPLWGFTRSFGRLGQTGAIVGWMTFPTVILYANRGLFPNLVVVCLTIWAAWLVQRPRSDIRGPTSLRIIIAGALAGLALIIRPVEAVWVLPWILVAYSTTKELKNKRTKEHIQSAIYFLIPLLIVCAIGAGLAWKTYGSPFAIGYQLRDTVTSSNVEQNFQLPTSSFQLPALPFGFHPRNVWFNVHSYIIEYLAPWFILAVVVLTLTWEDKRARIWIYLSAWTLAILALIYGQGLYQDHVQPNFVSLANSFLRYMIPIAAIGAISLGWFAGYLNKRFAKKGIVVALIITIILGAFGIWTAFARDDEGLLQNRVELVRYYSIRSQAQEWLDEGAIILSDRSDKIFFPAFHAVSPMPNEERVKELSETSGHDVALFIRTLDEERAEVWKDADLELVLLFTSGNEGLYLVQK
ncbi:hypothetical protein KKE33_00460 [Patescibacteria group bacterium]|nr:hypothetical protein [Patescibacteria group bacterium]